LLSGLDSLDLTCKTPAPKAFLADLSILKDEAGGDPRQAVLLPVGDEQLRVMASGMGAWWPFRLEHRFGQLAVGDAANRPPWRVSLSSEALHVQGAARVVEFWRSVIEALTGAPVVLMVSRLDVHADFAGLGIADADRSAFVCRSGRQSVEFEHGTMETLYFGKGGDVTVRIYDKLAEIKASGKGGHLLTAYGDAGLRSDDHVQRVEAQVRREALRSMHVMTTDDALARCGEVYVYVVGKWLRLIEQGSATRRERASLDTRWRAVQAATVGGGLDAARRIRAERHAPALDTIIANMTGWALRAGEALHIDNPETLWRQVELLVGAYLEDKGRDFTAEVRARLLTLGTSAA
jgi:hypothetical protein